MDGLRERVSLRGLNRELDSALLASRARIVATADAERRRLERDIHDGAQQRLVTMNLKLGMLRRQLVDDPVRAAATADELCGDAKLALAELRDLAHGIYPAVLENEGLTVALEDAGRRAAGVSVRVVSEDRERYSSEIEAAVYFCCLEALTNASKHAGEDAKVTLAISPVRDRLNFSITDDGPGFDSRSTKSHGLDNMSDRIRAVGGELVIRSSPGSGTTVRGWVPRTLAALPT
jgi:signal transduction histidine kinase